MKKWIAGLALVAVAVLGTGYWGFREYSSRQMLQTALSNNYYRAFYSLADHVQNMEVQLGKSLVTTGPDQYEELFDSIWQQSNQALDSLTQLPMGDALLGRTAKFITQLGDYSHMLSEQVAQGKPVTQEQRETLNRLYNQTSDLNKELSQVHAQVADGSLSFFELATNGRQRLSQEGKKLASSNFQTIDQQMHGYPTLIYDGPFSDHLEQGQARGVTGKKISPAKAKTIALQYFDKKGSGNVIAQVTGEVNGNIPAYRVEIVRRKDGAVVGEPAIADISQMGGHLIWTIMPRNVPNAEWNLEKARARAKDYLDKHGYKNMKSSYYQRNDNTATFNFALMEDGVIIYPDLIKVTVALDNGQVVGVDARGYLMSNHKRDLPKPKLTESQAREMVNKDLNIEGKGRLALIPVGVEKEKLTWEFKGTQGTETYLVYINALEGNEETILKLIKSDDGELTM